MKIILDLCGGTGAWSKPYQENPEYDVRTITLPEDVRLYIPPKEVYGILAAPPCDHFAVSGARWWKSKGDEALLESLSIVDACLRIIHITNPTFWCLENPIGRLKHYIGDPVFSFHPYHYGDPYKKKTLLWGDFNIPEQNLVEPIEGSKIINFGESKGRKQARSITPPGFAQAFYEANP